MAPPSQTNVRNLSSPSIGCPQCAQVCMPRILVGSPTGSAQGARIYDLLMDVATAASEGPAGAPNSTVIECRDLRKRYGDVEAVAGVSFDVRAGEVFGLLGPN